MRLNFALFLLTLSVNSFATIPEYNPPELLARANVSDGYNLPEMSFLSNTSPVINSRGDVSFKLLSFGGEMNQGLWVKLASESAGKIVYTAPDMRFVTEPSLNEAGKVAFNLYDDGITDGVFVLDTATNVVTHILDPEVHDKKDDIAFYTYPQILTNGKIYFRGTNQENIRSFYQFDGKLKPLITEGVTAFGQKASYLFKPYMNDNGAMTFKRRIGEAGDWAEENADEILLLKPNGNSFDSIVVAKDKDGDPNSIFKGFANSASLSSNGMVTFTAYLEDSSKAIILYKDGTSKNVAREFADDISEIELFSPKVNAQGQVLFRAKNTEGKRGIYLADTTGVKRLIGEGDQVMTDHGPAKILSNPNYPGFAGDVDMNDKGVIVFSCLIVGEHDNKELGSAIYTITPQ